MRNTILLSFFIILTSFSCKKDPIKPTINVEIQSVKSEKWKHYSINFNGINLYPSPNSSQTLQNVLQITIGADLNKNANREVASATHWETTTFAIHPALSNLQLTDIETDSIYNVKIDYRYQEIQLENTISIFNENSYLLTMTFDFDNQVEKLDDGSYIFYPQNSKASMVKE